MKEEEVLNAIATDLGMTPVTGSSIGKEVLVGAINNLLQHDFNKLVAILYRVDINEGKLQSLLQQHPGMDAADIIADLLIERQLQKLKSREQFRDLQDGINDEEKW